MKITSILLTSFILQMVTEARLTFFLEDKTAVLQTAVALNYDLSVITLYLYMHCAKAQSAFIFFSVFHRNRNGPTTNCAPLSPAQQPPSGHPLRRRRFMFARSSPSTKHFNKQPYTSSPPRHGSPIEQIYLVHRVVVRRPRASFSSHSILLLRTSFAVYNTILTRRTNIIASLPHAQYYVYLRSCLHYILTCT